MVPRVLSTSQRAQARNSFRVNGPDLGGERGDVADIVGHDPNGQGSTGAEASIEPSLRIPCSVSVEGHRQQLDVPFTGSICRLHKPSSESRDPDCIGKGVGSPELAPIVLGEARIDRSSRVRLTRKIGLFHRSWTRQFHAWLPSAAPGTYIGTFLPLVMRPQ